MREKLISKDDIRSVHPIFRGCMGDFLINFINSFTGINKVNAVYDASKHEPNGWAFTTDLIQKQGLTVKVENEDILKQFEHGPFITVSNHPYGHLDGIIAISVIAKYRPDFKLMVNWILNHIDTMAEHFICVNPYDKEKNTKLASLHSSLEGVKQSIEHLKAGHPMGFFPAGSVSFPHLFRPTEDREWQPSVLKLIKKAKAPIIPMYISGNNSLLYRALGLIDWRVRMVRLLHEVTNKRGKTIYVRLGQPISVEEQRKHRNIEDFGNFLKSRTYALK